MPRLLCPVAPRSTNTLLPGQECHSVLQQGEHFRSHFIAPSSHSWPVSCRAGYKPDSFWCFHSSLELLLWCHQAGQASSGSSFPWQGSCVQCFAWNNKVWHNCCQGVSLCHAEQQLHPQRWKATNSHQTCCSVTFKIHDRAGMKNGDLPHPKAVIILKVPFCLPVTWQNCPWLVWILPPSLSSTHSWWEQNCCPQSLKLCCESSSTTELHINTAGRNKPEPLGFFFSPIQISMQKAMLWSHSSLQETLQETIPSPLYGIFGTTSKMLLLKSQWQIGCSHVMLEHLHCLHLQPWDEQLWIVPWIAVHDSTPVTKGYLSLVRFGLTENPIQYLHQKWTYC